MNRLLEIGLANAAAATGLALLAALVGRIARRPALGHLLWALVLVKLITPPLWGVPFAWDFDAAPPNPPGVSAIPPEAPPLARTETAVIEDMGPIPDGLRQLAEIPADRPGPPIQEAARRDWRPWLIAAWLGGSLIFFAVAAVRVARFHRLLACAKPAPAALQERTREVAARIGLASCPGVWVVPVSLSPLLWAFGGPARLVLPSRLLERLKPDEQETLLAHELVHLRRRDHWVRWLELVAVGLYWWHPAAWWARRELGREEERCCDALVVGSLPGAALAYARALLKTVDFLSESRPALPTSASGIGPIQTLKGRVTMILRGPSNYRLNWPARLGAIALGLLVLPIGPRPLGARMIQDAADPAPSADGRGDRDFERRLRQLEEKIDRLAESLGSARGRRDSDDAAPARERRRARARSGRDAERSADAEPGKGKDEKEVKVFIDQKRLEEMAKQIEESVKKSIDPEKLERMAREIEESVKKGLDTKKIEEMAKEIEESVKRNIDTKQLEEMAKEIEESVKKGIDPEQIDALKDRAKRMAEDHAREAEKLGEKARERAQEQARRAEEQARRAKEQAERAEQRAREQAERAEKQARERAERAEQRARERAERDRDRAREEDRRERRGPEGADRDGPRRGDDRGTRDLERRLQDLERKLDRILDAQGRDRPSDDAPRR